MRENDRNPGASIQISLQDSESPVDAQFPPWLFRHKDLIRGMTSTKHIERKRLINIINFIHFKGESVYLLLGHPQYDEEILVKVHPEPCVEAELVCRWDPSYNDYRLEQYHFRYLLLSYDQAIILVPAQLIGMNNYGLIMQLPEISLATSKRQNPRFSCHDVKAELWQDGFQAEGTLIDFSPQAFRIRVEPKPPSSFHWFNPEMPAAIHLSNQASILYAGSCNCMYQQQNGHSREIILKPAQDQIQRFRAQQIRNPRRQNAPSLYVVFDHPLIQKKIQREIKDISISGFSIWDKANEAVLMPGMIIPDMIISYAGILKIHCKVQVIYRKEEADHQVRFGLVILDADLTNYKNLTQVVNHMQTDSGTSNEVDAEALWEFLFNTDFIYPKKYQSLYSFKDEFKGVYQRLYDGAPEIANHFTYQRNGKIYGHISILRVYERTWMAHHHAARPLEGKPVGLIVLKQMVLYLYDLWRLPSANFDYITAYYSPENEFPDRIFGGFAREAGNPQLCSLDLFAYIRYPEQPSVQDLPEGWVLRECTNADFWEFEQFYRNHSGGLCWSLFKRDKQQNTQSIEEIYTRSGFSRRWETYILAAFGVPKAFIVAEESDMGINLSNLLNGMKVFVMDSDLPADILLAGLSKLLKPHMASMSSLLIYPSDYAEKAGIGAIIKHYLLWIVDMKRSNEYLAYLKRKFRMAFI